MNDLKNMANDLLSRSATEKELHQTVVALNLHTARKTVPEYLLRRRMLLAADKLKLAAQVLQEANPRWFDVAVLKLSRVFSPLSGEDDQDLKYPERPTT